MNLVSIALYGATRLDANIITRLQWSFLGRADINNLKMENVRKIEISQGCYDKIMEAYGYLSEEAGYAISGECVTTETDIEYFTKGLEAFNQAMIELNQYKKNN